MSTTLIFLSGFDSSSSESKDVLSTSALKKKNVHTVAGKLAKTIAETTESDEKWRALGQAATIRGEIELASECLSKARDFGGLMLLASSAGSSKLMQQVATEATSAKEFNVSFVSHLLLGHVDECLETLISSNRIPEAAFFARTYCPSQVPRVLELWKAKTENNKVILAYVGKGEVTGEERQDDGGS